MRNDVRRTPTFRAGAPIEGDERVTNLDQSGRERLEPRPVSRPPVDPASRRAFGRPDGVDGSFVGLDRYRDQGEYTPKDQPPGPGACRGVRSALRRGRLATASPRRCRRAGG